jgi:hypothetical protein
MKPCEHCTEIIAAVGAISKLRISGTLRLLLIRATMNSHPVPRKRRRKRRAQVVKLVPPAAS